jgi:hypothetical protein
VKKSNSSVKKNHFSIKKVFFCFTLASMKKSRFYKENAFHSFALARQLAVAVGTRTFYPARYPARFCKFTIFVDVIFSYCTVAYKRQREVLQL